MVRLIAGNCSYYSYRYLPIKNEIICNSSVININIINNMAKATLTQKFTVPELKDETKIDETKQMIFQII